MAKVEVCFTPQAFPLFESENAIVVVIDVLRATSAICTAFHHGVAKIIPVATVEEAREFQKNGFLAAAERNGEIVEGFEFGNSPFSYMSENIKGKTIALTTTNGTQAIEAAKNAKKIIIGSFVNQDAVVDYLKTKSCDVILLCAGWKNKFNLEDTLFAGCIAEALLKDTKFESSCDSVKAASVLYNAAKNNIAEFLSTSSHRNRLSKLDLEKDINYCLTPNQTDVIPILEGKFLVKYH